MKITNPFRVGLVGGLGVLVALALGAAVAELATILTYIGVAIFLALGLDPIISFLERRRLPRWLAMVVVLLGVLIVIAGLVFAVVPVVVSQTTSLVEGITKYFSDNSWVDFLKLVQQHVGNSVDVTAVVNNVTSFVQKNVGSITNGALSVGLGIASGVGGALIVLILTLYFAASLDTFKQGLYKLVPMTKRQQFAEIAEQIFQSVGKYVIGQVGLALLNGVCSFILLTIIGAKLPAVFAFLAFIGALIPLVGTVSAAVLIVLGELALSPTNPQTWITIAIYYLIYMQVEAYVISPIVMSRAVKVPGVVVVIAALTGGALLGLLGALIAIPVAAAILLIIEQVVIPKQNER